MSIFIDTGIFVAARNKRDINHERAVELLHMVIKGRFGAAYTSDYIFDEAVTVALIRTGRTDIAIDIGKFILSSKKIRMIVVDKYIFRRAWSIFIKHRDKRLSFTDATSIAIIQTYKIDYIMSFDSHFDGIIARIY